MEIRVLRYFLETAREGNMTRAAERLHVTQPTLSKQIKELENEGEFPHEIGLFLGYDPEDVNGYLENKEPSDLKGYWKVYVNEEEKRKLFSKYKKCTKVYSDRLKNGKDFERMIVNKI